MIAELEAVPLVRKAPRRAAQRLPEELDGVGDAQLGQCPRLAGHDLAPRALALPFQENPLQLGVEVDAPADLHRLPGLLPAAGDQAVLLDFDVAPAQAEHLPAAHPRVG